MTKISIIMLALTLVAAGGQAQRVGSIFDSCVQNCASPFNYTCIGRCVQLYVAANPNIPTDQVATLIEPTDNSYTSDVTLTSTAIVDPNAQMTSTSTSTEIVGQITGMSTSTSTQVVIPVTSTQVVGATSFVKSSGTGVASSSRQSSIAVSVPASHTIALSKKGTGQATTIVSGANSIYPLLALPLAFAATLPLLM